MFVNWLYFHLFYIHVIDNGRLVLGGGAFCTFSHREYNRSLTVLSTWGQMVLCKTDDAPVNMPWHIILMAVTCSGLHVSTMHWWWRPGCPVSVDSVYGVPAFYHVTQFPFCCVTYTWLLVHLAPSSQLYCYLQAVSFASRAHIHIIWMPLLTDSTHRHKLIAVYCFIGCVSLCMWYWKDFSWSTCLVGCYCVRQKTWYVWFATSRSWKWQWCFANLCIQQLCRGIRTWFCEWLQSWRTKVESWCNGYAGICVSFDKWRVLLWVQGTNT